MGQFFPLAFVIVLIIFGIVLIDHGRQQRGHELPLEQAMDQSSLTYKDPEFRALVESFRQKSGRDLNLQRIAVEYENMIFAEDPLDGVPTLSLDFLDSHRVNRSLDNERSWLDPNLPDARVGYILEDEERRRAYLKEAQEAYILEFIRNVEAQGFIVDRVDGHKVTVRHRRPVRQPDSVSEDLANGDRKEAEK